MAPDFDTEKAALKRALKPTFKKYGAPQSYISGQMSGTYDAKYDRLHGTGSMQTKAVLPRSIYWQIDGQNLDNLLSPIVTVHLIYRTELMHDKQAVLSNIGNLTKKGNVFTVFERQVGEDIVVTVFRSAEVPDESELATLTFPENIGIFEKL